MRKWLAMLLLGTLLAGCAASGPKPAATSPTPSPESAPATTSEAPAEKELVVGEDPGTTVQVSYMPAQLPEVPVTISPMETGSLIFSDAPEYVDGVGTLTYSPVEPGDFRFYLYHVNNNTTDAYFHVVLTNKGDQPAKVKVTNHALAGPDKPYVPVGFDAQVQFYGGQEPYEITIAPGEWVSLDPRLQKTPVRYDLLLFGIWDVTTDQPLDVHEIASFSPEVPNPSVTEVIPKLETAQGAGAGTFPTYRQKAEVTLDGSAQHYKIASGLEGDRWLQGYDHLRQVESELIGNYGVDYEITMTFNSPVDRTVRVWMSTVAFLGGAIKIDGKMVRIPEDFFGRIDYPYDATLIAKLELKAGQTTTFTYEFMPPGSFCLPAIIHVEPES